MDNLPQVNRPKFHSGTEMFTLQEAQVIAPSKEGRQGEPISIYVQLKDGRRLWLPMSQIDHIAYGNEARQTTAIRMTVWIAKKVGLM
jgi:hypothetical protein